MSVTDLASDEAAVLDTDLASYEAADLASDEAAVLDTDLVSDEADVLVTDVARFEKNMSLPISDSTRFSTPEIYNNNNNNNNGFV